MAECNDYEGLRINPTPSSIGNQYAGVSTDDKPTGVPTYSIYLELDTGKFYYYDGAEWNEIPCSCSGDGGGEGSDFDTVPVTFVIGNGLGSFSYSATIDYPTVNPNTNNQAQYGVMDVIGNTTSVPPWPEIDSTQVVNVLTYEGIAYISQYFELYPYNDSSPISVSGYTLSGAAETVEDEESLWYGMIKVTGECTITLIRE